MECRSDRGDATRATSLPTDSNSSVSNVIRIPATRMINRAETPYTLPLRALGAHRRWPLMGPVNTEEPHLKDINLISSQSGSDKAKLLKFKWEWLRACNLAPAGRERGDPSNLAGSGRRRSWMCIPY